MKKYVKLKVNGIVCQMCLINGTLAAKSPKVYRRETADETLRNIPL